MIPKWKGKINDKLNLIEIKKENEKAGHRLGENIDKCVFDKKKKKKLVSNMYRNDCNSILIKLTIQFANRQKICTGLLQKKTYKGVICFTNI